MKIYTFEHHHRAGVGLELDGRLLDLNVAHAATTGRAGAVLAASVQELIQLGPAGLAQARAALEFARLHPVKVSSALHELATVRLRAPLPRPGKIICCGLNYRGHVEENPTATFLDDPRFFVKVSSAVIGPGDAIKWPGARFQVDYEVELAMVMGRTAHRLTPENALDHVFGYTILHDVSARWIQFKDKNEDMGKNFDTFCPMGPCIVTADEVPDPAKLRLSLKLNGQVMQNGTSEDWCFPPRRLLEWFTMGMTLEPGDIVTTGTPAGIGFFRQPPVFLKPGDVCELEISGIGKLTNPVVDATYRFLTQPHS